MPTEDLIDRIRSRFKEHRLTVEDASFEQLADYWRLLAKWNRQVNLTGLLLEGVPSASVDRLLVEPALAVRHLEQWDPASAGFVESPLEVWFDFGSGGGSPAIPMKILMAGVKLIMVEARSRKASFLREAIRELSLQATSVLDIRVEDVAGDYDGTADLITMRALRASNPIAAAAARLLKPGGRLLLFGSHEPDVHAAFSLSNAARLPTGKLFSFERNSTVD